MKRILVVALVASCILLPALLSGCSAGMYDTISDRARIVSVTYDSNVSGGPSGNLVEARNVPRDATLTVVIHPNRECYLRQWIWTLVKDRQGEIHEEYMWFRPSKEVGELSRSFLRLIPAEPTPLFRENSTYKVVLNLSTDGYHWEDSGTSAAPKPFYFSTGGMIGFDLFEGRPNPEEGRGVSFPQPQIFHYVPGTPPS